MGFGSCVTLMPSIKYVLWIYLWEGYLFNVSSPDLHSKLTFKAPPHTPENLKESNGLIVHPRVVTDRALGHSVS